MEDILSYIEKIAPGNYAAKASIDIALHDLTGKTNESTMVQDMGTESRKNSGTSFTIGIDKPDVVKAKVKEAAPYKILKVKLGQGNDKEMIETVRSRRLINLYVSMLIRAGQIRKWLLIWHIWLKDKGVVFVEQPMPKASVDDIAWLTRIVHCQL